MAEGFNFPPGRDVQLRTYFIFQNFRIESLNSDLMIQDIDTDNTTTVISHLTS